MQRKRIADASKGVGRPKVGGSFELLDQNGKPFTSEMMKGKYSLVWCYDPTDVFLRHLAVLGLGCEQLTKRARVRCTLDSLVAPIFVPKNSTKWRACST